MKGQVSTELLVIVGLILVVFIPLLVMVYFKSEEANQQIASYEAELAVSRLAYLANAVGSLGTNTSIYMDVYLPDDMASLTTSRVGNGGEIVMLMHTDQGNMEIVQVVEHRIRNPDTLAEEPSTGWMRVKITSVYEGGVAEVLIEGQGRED